MIMHSAATHGVATTLAATTINIKKKLETVWKQIRLDRSGDSKIKTNIVELV